MGFNDAVVVDDAGGGKATSAVSCSICFEAVTDNGDRSWAKLRCGHEFHLDCIGSAFNTKGAMQCPICQKIEKGQWLFANGSGPFAEFSIEDWARDEDIYDLSYSEMSFGVHWCPFGGLTRVPPSFDEGELLSTAYHDIFGPHAILAEHTAVPAATHPCPYIAYIGPIHSSSSNSSGSVSDGSNFNGQWGGPSVPSEIPTSYGFPTMDVHYHSWEHRTSAFPAVTGRIGGADQPSVPSMSQRATRVSSDVSRPGSYLPPFVVGHSSAAGAGSSVTSSMVPPYPGSFARTRDRVQALQAYSQQPNHSVARPTPFIPATRRSTSYSGVAQVGPVASSSDQTSGFVVFPSSSAGRSFQETENPGSSHYLPSFSLSQVDRDPVWGQFYRAAGGSDSGTRSNSFRARHGYER